MKFYPDSQVVMDNKLHYGLKRVFSFNVREMYLTGGRRFGKTYSVKSFIIYNFVNYGEKFAWVRTTDTALEKVANEEQFFGRLKNLNQLGVETFSVKNNTVYINNKIAGYFFSVSTHYNLKGADYSCTNIVYDEFMRESGERPLANRRTKFYKLVESISRDDGKRIFFLSNSTRRYDEMISKFNVKLEDFGVYLFREQNALIHYIAPSKRHIENMESGLSSSMDNDEKHSDLYNQFTDFGEYKTAEKLIPYLFLKFTPTKYLGFYRGLDLNIYCKCTTKPRNDITKLSFDSDYVNSEVLKITPITKKTLMNAFNAGRMKFNNGFSRDTFIALFK